MIRWDATQVAPVYWLVLWGLNSKDTHDLLISVFPDRSYDSINYMISQVRLQISILKGFEVGAKPEKHIAELVRKASKVAPIKEIADLKPLDLTKSEFIPSKVRSTQPRSKTPKPNFEQWPESHVPEKFELPDVKEIENTKSPQHPSTSPILGDILGKEPIFKRMVGVQTGRISSGEPIQVPDIANKEYSLEEVLNIAKKVGATKVCYKDFIIKFS